MLGHQEHMVRGQATDLSSYETFHMESYDPYLIHVVVHWDRSYSFQSHAYIDVWNANTLTWNRVADLLPHEVDTEYNAAELLRVIALQILWGEDPR